MRQIKFRAWNGKELGYFSLGDICAHGSYIYTDKGNEYDSDMPITQYTSLKDKNGKEIYEGDIVKWYYETEDREFVLGPVKWVEDCSLWALDVGYALTHIEPEDLFIQDTPYEVIGNIYENSELLK